MKNVLLLVLFCFFAMQVTAVEGFNEFKFGDDPDTVLDSGNKKCNFNRLAKDSRWIWKSYLSCRNYDFKKGIKVTIHFEFSNDELRRIYVVSVDMKDYFLIRYPRYEYLIPIQREVRKQPLINLADELMVKDKVHRLDKGYRYINFFHNGSWQWEFIYEDYKYIKKDMKKEEDQLEEEAEKGLPNWNDFLFDDDDEAIKKKLEGFCSASKTVAALNKRKVIHCSDFPFMNNKIEVLFSFVNNKLVLVDLRFAPTWYKNLLPLLKRKYGRPYSELEKNAHFYPYINFPEKNILLIHRINKPPKKDISVSLIYYKEDYLNKNELLGKIGKEKTPADKSRERSNQILDSI